VRAFPEKTVLALSVELATLRCHKSSASGSERWSTVSWVSAEVLLLQWT
jgi:hypothetical protein